jgi:hypothetical protein
MNALVCAPVAWVSGWNPRTLGTEPGCPRRKVYWRSIGEIVIAGFEN